MKLAIIGGSGALGLFTELGTESLTTPFGAPSARPRHIEINGSPALFLARHGDPHRIPPHRVNYRANLHALKTLGAEAVITINAVGGVDPGLASGNLVIPDQLIDYTWGRAHSYSDGGSALLKHIEFAQPFAGRSRQALIDAASTVSIETVNQGCYGVTQGPRLETAAEIQRLRRDGCTIVGMTLMPEAGLARELELDYAGLCIVANPAAGISDEPITEADIHHQLAQSMHLAHRIIEQAALALM